MKKRSLMGALLCSICLVASSAVPAMADGTRVVTLGADLTQEQKNTMLNYFKVNSGEVQILTITNQDEREHLSGYVPMEQIGTRTVSCAYVKPTTSGGIKVRTANLNWVTCNMIASSLSTSGVKNCEVVAACPFEVSGTGALTGIEMAYEAASGQKLDPVKKDVATKEMVVTSNLGERVGQKPATNVVNGSKIEVIENNVTNRNDIESIVVNNIEQNNITVNNDEVQELVDLLEQIAQQNYDYEDVRETLENVDANVNDNAEPSPEEDEPVSEDAGESILDDLDGQILGDNVVEDSTEDPSLAIETGRVDEAADESKTDDEGWTTFPEEEAQWEENTEATETEGDGWTEDEYTETDADTGEVLPEEEGWGYEESDSYDDYEDYEDLEETTENYEEISDVVTEDEGTTVAKDTSMLNEQQKAQFEQAEQFCKGEYEGDMASLQAVMGSEAYTTVVLDAETGKKVTELVENAYLEVLKDGGATYEATGMELYNSTELNMMNKKLKEIFGIENTASEELDSISEMDKETLYYDTLTFFEKIYGEGMDTAGDYYEEEGYSEEAGEEY